MLHDDCLGRTLEWRYDHDPTALFAGIARQARQRFGITARQLHVNTTSFSVTGEYEADLDAQTLAVTYGYSRNHRADLKQWMLALATTRTGDVPLFCQALDGNASDKLTLVAAVEALVVVRKISGGSRSPRGSQTGMRLATLFATWTASGLDPLTECRRLLPFPALALASLSLAWYPLSNGSRF